jgi:hypothetical protein
MAVTSLLPNYWDNEDGLRVKFPGSAATLSRGGERSHGAYHESFVVVELAKLATVSSTNKQIILEDAIFPLGAIVDKVDLIVRSETAGTNANLNVGFVKTDRSTELDFDGLLAAADDFNAGTDVGKVFSYTAGSTEAGVLLGIPLTAAGILTAHADTADFTDGTIELRLFWSVPLAADVA